MSEKYTAQCNYAKITYRGRVIQESKDPSYCGSCHIDLHVDQMNNPKSWVQSSLKKWAELCEKEEIKNIAPKSTKVCYDIFRDFTKEEALKMPKSGYEAWCIGREYAVIVDRYGHV